MAEVWFYHLERSTLEQTLPDLLERTLQRGWRAVVRAREPERVAQLDEMLWTYREDSFLPHGVDHEPNAARQPILLTTAAEAPNAPDALFVVGGAELGDTDSYERCMVVFDGGDEAELAVARAQYRAAKASGATVAYWRQTTRGWEKQG
jgi:DNA polymerase-3 subunit chi